MKKLFVVLFLVLFIGCGYERVYIDIKSPFVISEIILIEDIVIFKAEKINLEFNFGWASEIVLSHDYGYRVGDTLRILDMRKVNNNNVNCDE